MLRAYSYYKVARLASAVGAAALKTAAESVHKTYATHPLCAPLRAVYDPAPSDTFWRNVDRARSHAPGSRRGLHTSSTCFQDHRDTAASPKTDAPPPTLSPIPSSRLSRLFHVGQLAALMGAGAALAGAKHLATSRSPPLLSQMVLSPGNLARMADKFLRMRGAALKVGQMLSFQDLSVLPPEIAAVLARVQNLAHYMPAGQLEQVMVGQLGKGWRGKFYSEFADVPIAAALIGQVHRAVTLEDYTPVVVKVQYPGVAALIDSDLNNLLMLLTASRLLPKGLFLDRTVANARTELKWECDYLREAQNIDRMRALVAGDATLRELVAVPRVMHSMSGAHVLTMERMEGTEVAKGTWDQETRNFIAATIMRLTLTEIKWQFMQTDPNWANFLYNPETRKVELLDFGACRDFGDDFSRDYIAVLKAAAARDAETVRELSLKLGYLTGMESEAMTKAHVDSVLVLGEPFLSVERTNRTASGAYDFKLQTVTDRVRDNIGLMLDQRLAPPPEETYLLHRKMSGVFLLCARLGAQIDTEGLFREVLGE